MIVKTGCGTDGALHSTSYLCDNNHLNIWVVTSLVTGGGRRGVISTLRRKHEDIVRRQHRVPFISPVACLSKCHLSDCFTWGESDTWILILRKLCFCAMLYCCVTWLLIWNIVFIFIREDQPVIVQHSINKDISRIADCVRSFNTQIVINGRFISFVSKQAKKNRTKKNAFSCFALS